jgi:anti-sigma regulatory factor (Ser/Thr protein kinase)
VFEHNGCLVVALRLQRGEGLGPVGYGQFSGENGCRDAKSVQSDKLTMILLSLPWRCPCPRQEHHASRVEKACCRILPQQSTPRQSTARIPLPSFEELQETAAVSLSRQERQERDDAEAARAARRDPFAPSRRIDPVALDLAATPAAAGIARAFVEAVFVAESLHGIAGTAQLLVSELVTNAFRHARSPSRLQLIIGERSVHVDVIDCSPWRPTLQHPSPQLQAQGGWGLLLVDALADRWGYELLESGKRVWFELDFKEEKVADG